MSELTQAHHDHLAVLNVCALAERGEGDPLPLCGCELCQDWMDALAGAARDVNGWCAVVERLTDVLAWESRTYAEVREVLLRELVPWLLGDEPS